MSKILATFDAHAALPEIVLAVAAPWCCCCSASVRGERATTVDFMIRLAMVAAGRAAVHRVVPARAASSPSTAASWSTPSPAS